LSFFTPGRNFFREIIYTFDDRKRPAECSSISTLRCSRSPPINHLASWCPQITGLRVAASLFRRGQRGTKSNLNTCRGIAHRTVEGTKGRRERNKFYLLLHFLDRSEEDQLGQRREAVSCRSERVWVDAGQCNASQLSSGSRTEEHQRSFPPFYGQFFSFFFSFRVYQRIR
jgi:hypothetical protein